MTISHIFFVFVIITVLLASAWEFCRMPSGLLMVRLELKSVGEEHNRNKVSFLFTSDKEHVLSL